VGGREARWPAVETFLAIPSQRTIDRLYWSSTRSSAQTGCRNCELAGAGKLPSLLIFFRGQAKLPTRAKLTVKPAPSPGRAGTTSSIEVKRGLISTELCKGLLKTRPSICLSYE